MIRAELREKDERKLTSRAATMLQRRMPRRKPLYWKWMWSTIMRPGWKMSETAMMKAVG